MKNFIDETLLKSLVEEGLSQRGLAKKLKVNVNTIKKYLKRYGLKTNYVAEENEKHKCDCGNTIDDKNFYGRVKTKCSSCSNQISIGRMASYKKDKVNYLGGKCVCCGYNKYIGNLAFHHLDPSQKDPNYKIHKTRTLESVKEELNKCVLVCHNCHGEIHAGLINLVDILVKSDIMTEVNE